MNNTNKLILKCFNLQNELNMDTFNKVKDKISKVKDGVNPNGTWITSNFNYGLAALEELGEATKELGYHWWKFSAFNKQKFYSELVDVFHFVLSVAIQDRHYAQGKTEYDKVFIEKYFFEDRSHTDQNQYKILPVDTAIKLLCQNLFNYGALHYFFQLCLSAKLDLDKLCIMYIGKNALNKFRLDNGYSDGTYSYKQADNSTLEILLSENNDKYVSSEVDGLQQIIYEDLSMELKK